jgi:hypothetical protein
MITTCCRPVKTRRSFLLREVMALLRPVSFPLQYEDPSIRRAFFPLTGF